MTYGHIFRSDQTNVGDWYCAPFRYFDFQNTNFADILNFETSCLFGHVIVGGGGLLANFFEPHMNRICDMKPKLKAMVAWGVGESLNIDTSAQMVLPYNGQLPDYLRAFDLVGIRDFGTDFRWVPCVSCMHPAFDYAYPVKYPVCVYEHKRIPIPIEGFPKLSNDGNDIIRALQFMGGAEIVITNSYHGAYWATLLGKRVLCFASMSKMYRMKHAPVICRPDAWKRYMDLVTCYPNALAECRAANKMFYTDVLKLGFNSES